MVTDPRHRLRIVDFQGATAKAFWEIQLRAEGNDDTSYGRIASLLQSAPLVNPVSLGELWNMTPELHLDHPVGNFNQPRWTQVDDWTVWQCSGVVFMPLLRCFAGRSLSSGG